MQDQKAQQLRHLYAEKMAGISAAFDAHVELPTSGSIAIQARAEAVDSLVQSLWTSGSDQASGVAVVAVGGYGRRELFPFSDVDLMFLLDAKLPEKSVEGRIRILHQQLWDSGLRVSP